MMDLKASNSRFAFILAIGLRWGESPPEREEMRPAPRPPLATAAYEPDSGMIADLKIPPTAPASAFKAALAPPHPAENDSPLPPGGILDVWG